MENPDFKLPLLDKSLLDLVETKFLDIPYAFQSERQVLDIYYPKERKDQYPVIVYFHGGAFMFGSQRDVNLGPILRILDYGYVLISVKYRVSGTSRFPALLFDAKAAIRFIRANANKYNLNVDRIGAWGPSAGGWIVSMLGVTNHQKGFEDLSMGNAEFSSSVQAVVDWCGPCGNFLQMDLAIRENGFGDADHNDPESPESRLIGAPIELMPELVQLASPLFHASEDAPPFMIHHGEKDPIVPVQQSLAFAEALKEKGVKVELETFEGKGHHGQPWYDVPEMTDRVARFFDLTIRR